LFMVASRMVVIPAGGRVRSHRPGKAVMAGSVR
jgi:hypothetical protein